MRPAARGVSRGAAQARRGPPGAPDVAVSRCSPLPTRRSPLSRINARHLPPAVSHAEHHHHSARVLAHTRGRRGHATSQLGSHNASPAGRVCDSGRVSSERALDLHRRNGRERRGEHRRGGVDRRERKSRRGRCRCGVASRSVTATAHSVPKSAQGPCMATKNAIWQARCSEGRRDR